MLRDQKDQKETIKSGAADIFSFHQQHLWPHQENIKKRNFSAPCGTAALKHWFEEFPHLSHSVTPSQWKKRAPSATEQQPLCSVQLRDSMSVATTADQALETWKAWSCGQVLCSTFPGGVRVQSRNQLTVAIMAQGTAGLSLLRSHRLDYNTEVFVWHATQLFCCF